MNDIIQKRIGARIRAARVQQGFTAADVGGCIGVSYQQVWKYEVAKSSISAKALAEIARVLSTPISFFFEEITLPSDMLTSNSGRVALLAAYNKLNATGRTLLISIAKSLAEADSEHQIAAE
jgi:transcriptional regulator with XRE-family HTH domain